MRIALPLLNFVRRSATGQLAGLAPLDEGGQEQKRDSRTLLFRDSSLKDVASRVTGDRRSSAALIDTRMHFTIVNRSPDAMAARIRPTAARLARGVVS